MGSCTGEIQTQTAGILGDHGENDGCLLRKARVPTFAIGVRSSVFFFMLGEFSNVGLPSRAAGDESTFMLRKIVRWTMKRHTRSGNNFRRIGKGALRWVVMRGKEQGLGLVEG